jgi:type IV fimbrial biogenesis protein FimT
MHALTVRKSSGFTFIELVITLAVAAVVTSIALPSLSGLIRNTRVKQTASDMVMTLAYARNEAVNRNAQVSVVALGTWNAGWQVVAGGAPLRQTALSGEVTVGGTAPSMLTYNPDGRLATLTTLSFVFSVPGNTEVLMRCVSATLMGQPVLQSDANRDGDCTNG